MPETIKEKEFVELEFTGRIKGGEIFDTNKKTDLDKMHKEMHKESVPEHDYEHGNEHENEDKNEHSNKHEHSSRHKHEHQEEQEHEKNPLIICVGENMILHAFDHALLGKELEKEYEIELNPEEAFGKRNPSLVKTLPIKIFLEKDIQPRAGMVFVLDNFLIKIISVSGGRVIADFNNPLAGRHIIYEFKVKRIVIDLKEKINALMDFFLKKRLKFEVDGKEIKIKEPDETLEIFKDKFNQILGMDIVLPTKQK